GIRTLFNILGPLSNPAKAPSQVLGVYAGHLVPIVGETMLKLGVRHGFVVHGSGGLDEISLTGETEIAEVRDGAMRLWKFSPADVGVAQAPVSALSGGDAAENAAILRAVFAGETGPRRDIVLVNAAAALITGGIATDFRDGIYQAARAIDSGAVERTLASLVEFGRNQRK
ncbi:MAG: anthranilate phosphoribosyltransferase, partial [Acidobacteriaceae bacterium]